MQSFYTLSGITFQKFSEQLDNFWAEILNDTETRKWVKDQGIEIEKIDKMKRSEAIMLKKRREGGGLDEATVKIIVIFAPLAAKILKDLWDKVILRKIERKIGYKAIEESKTKSD